MRPVSLHRRQRAGIDRMWIALLAVFAADVALGLRLEDESSNPEAPSWLEDDEDDGPSKPAATAFSFSDLNDRVAADGASNGAFAATAGASIGKASSDIAAATAVASTGTASSSTATANAVASSGKAAATAVAHSGGASSGIAVATALATNGAEGSGTVETIAGATSGAVPAEPRGNEEQLAILATVKKDEEVTGPACTETVDGEVVGCEGGCVCSWSQQCYTKHVSGNNVGACGMAMHFLVLISFGIIVGVTLFVVILRLALQSHQFVRDAYEKEVVKGRLKMAINQSNPSSSSAFADADRRIRGSSLGSPNTPRSDDGSSVFEDGQPH